MLIAFVLGGDGDHENQLRGRTVRAAPIDAFRLYPEYDPGFSHRCRFPVRHRDVHSDSGGTLLLALQDGLFKLSRGGQYAFNVQLGDHLVDDPVPR
ncbi:hypothetical protein D3C81_1862610 [compost metagenome]